MTLLEWCGVSLYERLFVEDYEGMSREARDPLWDAAVDLRKTAGLPSAFLGAEVVHQLACSYVARAGDMAQVRAAAGNAYGSAGCPSRSPVRSKRPKRHTPRHSLPARPAGGPGPRTGVGAEAAGGQARVRRE